MELNEWQLATIRPKLAGAHTASLVASEGNVTVTIYSPTGDELDAVTLAPNGAVVAPSE